MDLVIENIRCFAGRHTIPIKPITLLTGQNSSGKSTFLASLAAVHNHTFPFRPRFNEAPYSLGNFDNIATYKGGRYGRAEHFSLGYAGSIDSSNRLSKLIATYVNRDGLVVLSRLTLGDESVQADINVSPDNGKMLIKFDVSFLDKKSGESHAAFTYLSPDSRQDTKGKRFDEDNLMEALYDLRSSEADRQTAQVLAALRESMFKVIDSESYSDKSVSIAPIRTKPRRTYDQVTEEFTPEGEHIPFVLSGLLENVEAKKALEQFGAESGLFSHINVKKLGNKISDPIQVLVTNTSRPANLLDVGYGVSQALPVVVESLLASPNRLLLLQQPEVHLHPKAQAALGSLITSLRKSAGKQFVIETHSDYIIDRVRQEVARGRVDVDDVQILYFEKHGSETQVFPIAIDKGGNVVDPPPSYRDFFMEEEMNLLSRAKD